MNQLHFLLLSLLVLSLFQIPKTDDTAVLPDDSLLDPIYEDFVVGRIRGRITASARISIGPYIEVRDPVQEKESNAIDDLEGAEPRLPDENEFPAPFVLVELSGPDGTNAVRKTITDSLGEFAFASVPEGEYRFRTSYLHFRPRVGGIVVSKTAPPDRIIQIQIRPARFFDGALRWFTISPTEYIVSRQFKPVTLAAPRGQVRSLDEGVPMWGVLVEVRGPGESDRIQSAVTDAEGRFEFSDLVDGTYVWKATCIGFRSQIGSLIVSKEAPEGMPWQVSLAVGD